jgi:hypothetical protein
MLIGLVLTGLSLRWVEASLWATLRAGEPALRLDSSLEAAGQGVVLGVLGGFRGAVADIIWLRAQMLVEARNLPAAESLLGLVTAIDPRPLYFWLNGARIMAYDMPEWRIAATGGYSTVPVAVQERIRREQAQRALARLDDAMRFHPSSAALWIERANLQLNRLGDMAGAAESYRRAWEQPGAPYFAARLHAVLLRRLGRKAEAHTWLVGLHPQLPASDESAGAALVLTRIRELERELGVPAGQGYCQRAGRGFDPD